MKKDFIHRNNPIKQPKLIYTRSYPRYPPTKKRMQSGKIRENRNGCFVKYDKDREERKKNTFVFEKMNCPKTIQIRKQ